MFACEDAPGFNTGHLNTAARDGGIRSSEINVFEEAAFGVGFSKSFRAHPLVINDDDFARFNLADERRTDDVERRGFTRQHPTALEPAEGKRADPLRVACAIQGVVIHEHE